VQVSVAGCSDSGGSEPDTFDAAPELPQEEPAFASDCPADPLYNPDNLAAVCQRYGTDPAGVCYLEPVTGAQTTCWTGCGATGNCGTDETGEVACLVDGVHKVTTEQGAFKWEMDRRKEEDPCTNYYCNPSSLTWTETPVCIEELVPVPTGDGQCLCIAENPEKVEKASVGELHAEFAGAFVSLNAGFGALISRSVSDSPESAGPVHGAGRIRLAAWVDKTINYSDIMTVGGCSAHDIRVIELNDETLGKDNYAAVLWVESCEGVENDALRIAIVNYIPGSTKLVMATPPFTISFAWQAPWTPATNINSLTAASIGQQLIPIALSTDTADTLTPLHVFLCQFEGGGEGSSKIQLDCGHLMQTQLEGTKPALVARGEGSFDLLYADADGNLNVQLFRYDQVLDNVVPKPAVTFGYAGQPVSVDSVKGVFTDKDGYVTFVAQNGNMLVTGYYMRTETNQIVDSFCAPSGEYEGLAAPWIQEVNGTLFFGFLRNTEDGFLHPFVQHSDDALANFSCAKPFCKTAAHVVSVTARVFPTLDGFAVAQAAVLTDAPSPAGDKVGTDAYSGQVVIWPEPY